MSCSRFSGEEAVTRPSPTSGRNQRIVRVLQGTDLPDGWEYVEWIGVDHDFSARKLDVVLVEQDATTPEGKPPFVTMLLDAYEVANLRALLLVARKIGLDTGDWHGQILNRLATVEDEQTPNVTVEDQYRRVRVPDAE